MDIPKRKMNHRDKFQNDKIRNHQLLLNRSCNYRHTVDNLVQHRAQQSHLDKYQNNCHHINTRRGQQRRRIHRLLNWNRRGKGISNRDMLLFLDRQTCQQDNLKGISQKRRVGNQIHISYRKLMIRGIHHIPNYKADKRNLNLHRTQTDRSLHR